VYPWFRILGSGFPVHLAFDKCLPLQANKLLFLAIFVCFDRARPIDQNKRAAHAISRGREIASFLQRRARHRHVGGSLFTISFTVQDIGHDRYFNFNHDSFDYVCQPGQYSTPCSNLEGVQLHYNASLPRHTGPKLETTLTGPCHGREALSSQCILCPELSHDYVQQRTTTMTCPHHQQLYPVQHTNIPPTSPLRLPPTAHGVEIVGHLTAGRLHCSSHSGGGRSASSSKSSFQSPS
jgi:hypothetical protein